MESFIMGFLLLDVVVFGGLFLLYILIRLIDKPWFWILLIAIVLAILTGQ